MIKLAALAASSLAEQRAAEYRMTNDGIATRNLF
jgi:hypothetical protein